PARPALDGLEAAWSKRWSDEGTYHFDPAAPRERVYSIDTPPPTVSGSLHVGHVFSFTHTDTIARYKRMQGYSVWYPIGWDDNGLPTERRVQNFYGVRCDPSLPYVAGLVPPAEGGLEKGQAPVAISRPNFVELCERLTAEDERAFEETWRHVGLSYDWRQLYTTIGEKSRRASQRSFLRLLRRGQAYAAEAPTLWDVDFRTAVAQAELVDKEVPGAFHTLAFHKAGGGDLLVETTRPELLPACVAVVVHPEDARYGPLVGTEALTPLFGALVPVVAHKLAQPDKGTGAAMVCTFGDLTDVTWWRELSLPVRAIVGRDGRLLPSAPEGLSARGAALYETELAGKRVAGAQQRLVELLGASGELIGAPRPLKHPVKFYEKGDRPLEIVTSRQWWISTLAHKEALLERGRQLRWHPPFMRARYEDWVNGLTSDWLISRQRFFGMPFPVWYRVGEDGSVDHAALLLPGEADLPVDPTTDVPAGFSGEQRGAPGGFVGDPDVMDTWATSSLTPQIAGGWEDPAAGDRWSRIFPMDLRPQGHDIIRTWLFATVVRSHLEHGTLPWWNAAISGWILDPDRKKMGKSTGNVVTPRDLLEKHGSDAVRYWACSARLGVDTAFTEGQMEVGRKLVLKVLNASKFVLSPNLWSGGTAGEDGSAPAAPEAAARAADAALALEQAVRPVDLALLHSLGELVAVATRAFEDYDHARALERTEAWFWDFCDNYLELVKARAYGEMGPEAAGSARTALAASLSVLLRLFAPFMPFVTEEVWSWWQAGSVHRAAWPEGPYVPAEAGAVGSGRAYEEAVALLAAIRRVKSEARVGPRSPVARVVVSGPTAQVEALRLAEDDLRAAQ
ncbi:MAG TPA: valine--tRNA ligase, partial [Acidimicrobiales bacterium]|nr:valine--tRNA ligase [Acidimicrobiales bacterium]